MTQELVLNLIIILMGTYFAIRFRFLGRTAIEQRKKLNKALPFPQSEEDFDKTAIFVTQFMFLFIGILFTLVGVTKLLL